MRSSNRYKYCIHLKKHMALYLQTYSNYFVNKVDKNKNIMAIESELRVGKVGSCDTLICITAILYVLYTVCVCYQGISLQWRHNERDGVSNHRRLDCLLYGFSGADQRKHQSSASLAYVRGIHRWPRWIPLTNGQQRGKCFHLMTSSCGNHIQYSSWLFL